MRSIGVRVAGRLFNVIHMKVYFNHQRFVGRLFGLRPCARLLLGWLLLGWLLLVGPGMVASSAHALESITLQLKWKHQFQFAGYYAALEQGYYRDAGLDVHIIEGHIKQPPLQQVLSGNVTYGITDSDILLSRMRGQPVVALAAIFQHSPYVLLSLKDRGITGPQDLIGKRVMLSSDQGASQFRAMLFKQRIDIARMTIVPHTWRLQDLIAGKVDVMSAYAMDEPLQLEQKGYAPAIISNQQYGMDFYGDILFTTEREVRDHPKRVAAFLRATKKGWAHAFAHKGMLAAHISQMPGVAKRGLNKQLLLKEARLMEPYVMSDVVELGHMNRQRWESIARTFVETGMASGSTQLDDFVYMPAQKNYPQWLKQVLPAALVVLGLTVLWNLQIRRVVVKRTRALQNEIKKRTHAEQLLRIAGNVAQIGGWVMDVKSGMVTWSDEVAAIHEMPVGYSPSVEEGIALFVPEHRDIIREAVTKCIQDGTTYDLELEKITATGRRIWVRTMGQPVRDQDGSVISLQGSFQNITARKRLEAIEQGQHLIQALMLAKAPVAELLKTVLSLIETHFPACIGSIMLLDREGKCLRHAASNKLPERYLQAIDTMEIGPQAGSSGSCAYDRQRMIVDNIETHPHWQLYRQLALSSQLRAFWSTPILSSDGRLLGVFAMYYRHLHTPDAGEIEFVEHYAQRLGIAIERQQSEAHLGLLRSGISRLNDIVMITEAPLHDPLRQKIVFLNEAFDKITGIASADMIGQSAMTFLARETEPLVMERLKRALGNMNPIETEVTVLHQNQSEISLELDMVPLHDTSGRYTHWVIVMRDITQRKLSDLQIRQLAYYDTMTGLPNRLLLNEQLSKHLERVAFTETHGAVLFIDIDNFKSLNDTHGHDVGDMLLIEVANRIVQALRPGDTVSRLGGDEFVVVLDALDHDEVMAVNQIYNVCDKLLAAFKQSFVLNKLTHHTTTSIGVAMFGYTQPTTIDELLRRADLAMYQAKAAGRNTVRLFDKSMEERLLERVALETDLHAAIVHQQFQLHFQSQYNHRREVVGAEALIRWQHPDRGLIMPGQFIGLAEDTGQIIDIGRWVLQAACAQLLAWKAHPLLSRLVLSVNVSPKQFLQADFVDEVVALVQSSGIEPSRLKLELTESMLVESIESVIVKMNVLRTIGVRFSLDDFGTGYSSLSYLKRLPFDQLKIDQSFVRDLLHSPHHAQIVTTIISLGHSLGLEVLAEGVETEAQLDSLHQHGCRSFQGYLFTRPLALAAFEQLVVGAER